MLFSGKRHAITLIRVIKSVFPSSKVKDEKARRLRKE